jgi:hypothetical protein
MIITKSIFSFLIVAWLLVITPVFAQVNRSLPILPIRVYGANMDPLIRENINWALNKFWNKTPINDPSKEIGWCSLIEVSDFEVITRDPLIPRYYFSQFIVSISDQDGSPHMVNAFGPSPAWAPFIVPFDNIRRHKNSNEVIWCRQGYKFFSL